MAQSNGNSSLRARPSAAAFTNLVTSKDTNKAVKTRIDPSLAVADVVKQICVNLHTPRPPTEYALRDDAEELVTDDNLRRMIRTRAHLTLGNAPVVEAREIVDRLAAPADPMMRLTLHHIQRYARELEFADEFLRLGGLYRLIDVIHSSHGNVLAYALTAMQNLMALDHGWAVLDKEFIAHIVSILISPTSLINVCRPATAILRRLVEADPSSAPGSLAASSSSRAPPPPPPGSIYRYGFSVVYEQMMAAHPVAFDTVAARIGAADTALSLHSVLLINSLLAHAPDAHADALVDALEHSGTRRAVARLVAAHTADDLSSSVLDFQANIARAMYRAKTTFVDPGAEQAHADALAVIWAAARTDAAVDAVDGSEVKWRQLGFESEDLGREFADVGVLGLYCLKYFVMDDPDFFRAVVQEQASRAPDRRCPLAHASNEVVELLAEHWAIFAPGYAVSPAFQPFFLDFYRVHGLALRFFLRMWTESGAGRGDFARIVALVRGQVKIALRDESSRPWQEMEADFAEIEYRAVRDRQMKELVEEDDLLSKVPIRNLREKLTREANEFVQQQRIHCLMQGAWFMNAIPITAPAQRRPSRPWRFMRLDKGMKYLHYVDSQVKFPVRDGLEDLPERIELSLVSEIATRTCALPPPPDSHAHGHGKGANSGSTPSPSPLSFSLLTSEGSLADQIAPDVSRWADWTDGLNMLRRDSGHVTSQETADFVQALTDIGLKIKLLDLSGDKVEIPSGLNAGPPPLNSDFYFSDFYDPQ